MFEKLLRKIDPIKLATDSASASTNGSSNRGKVLLVDDDAVVVRALSYKIKAAGYEVFTAQDGADAVAIARRERPNVIILDINFPPEPGLSWDGFKIMEWLHRPTESFQSPIVIITGDDSDMVRRRCLAEGAAGFFHKPVDMPALLAALEKLTASTPELTS